MSNPTELLDLDKLEALARAADTDITACARFTTTFDPEGVLALIALARRAQPEGEAPQAEPICKVCGADVALNGETCGVCFWKPAATLSPLCGAQSIDGLPRYKLVPGDQREWMAPAADGPWCKFDHARAALAAQQAAAPGALAIEAAKLAPILRGMCEGGDVHGDGVDIYADGYIAGDGDTYVVRAAALLEQIAATSAPGTPEAPKPAHGHRDDYYLLANGRRLALEPISRVRNMPNWVLAMELFATGSTSAHQLCRDAGIDPDSTTIQRAAAPKGGV